MLTNTVTHATPWTDPDDVAWCGAQMTEDTPVSASPTCPTCAHQQAIADAVEARLADEAVIELTDDDARYAGETVITPAPERDRVLADALFTYAVALTRSYANHFPPEARLFAGRRRR